MAFGRGLPLLAVAWIGCGRDDKAPETAPPPGVEIEKRCLTLAKLCGDKSKHVEKMADECKQAATKQQAKSCVDKAMAVYDCYERDVCGKGDKVWTLGDLEVLSTRHKACAAEQTALHTCMGDKP